MMKLLVPAILLLLALMAAPVVAQSVVAQSNVAQSNAELKEQVRNTERSFAKTMADRDHAAFVGFLSEEAVFFSANGVLRGPRQVGDGWKRFYDGPKAPFSWEPDQVEVLDSGTLALSSGPVWDADHKRIGTFSSIWRREPDGTW